MDFLKPVDFKQLKAFFLALQQSHFNLKQISTAVIVDGVRTPIDKAHCLELLRSFSDLHGEEFKDDNYLVKYLSQPGNIKRILGRLSREQQIELTKVLEEKPITAVATNEQGAPAKQGESVQTTADTTPSTIGISGLPSGETSAYTSSRIIHNIPHTPEPETPPSKLYVANKSGVIVEEHTITPTSATINKPVTPSKIYIANKSGTVVGERPLEPRLSTLKDAEPETPKILAANKSGVVTEAPPSKIYVANKSGRVTGEKTVNEVKGPGRRRLFQIPKIPYGVTNLIKNFASRAGVLFQRTFGKYLTAGRIATFVSTGIGAFVGAGLTKGSALGMFTGAGAGSILPSWVRSGDGAKFFRNLGGKTIDVGTNLSNQISGRGVSLPGPKKRVLAGALALFSLFFLASLIGGLIPGQDATTGEAAPLPGSSRGISVGVNVHSLAFKEPTRINHILQYLNNSCGVTLVRIFFTSDEIDKLKQTLDIGAQNGVKFIISLADYANRPNDLLPFDQNSSPTGWYKDDYKQKYRAHVENVVTGVRGHPAIYAWELANEPHCNGNADCVDPYHGWALDTATLIKGIDPTHLVSIGTMARRDIDLGDSPGNGQYEQNNSISSIGALSGHYYSDSLSSDKPFMLKDIAIAKKLNKPFYIGEGGFSCNSTPCTTASADSENARATLLRQEISEMLNAGASAYLVWQYSDRKTDYIDNDPFSFFEGDPICSVLKEASQKTVSIPGGTTDINSCQFTRAGVSKPIGSSKLISILQEVSAKSGVPASALASLAMHESQDFTVNAKDDHDAFSDPNPTSDTGCKYFLSTKKDGVTKVGSSPTGALGIMQIQPPKGIHNVIAANNSELPTFEQAGAYSADGVERGAKMIGKTADTLTLADFCNIRTSVYIGAGVLISKNGGKPPTNGSEVNKSVCGYYGSCEYGGYNYGNEAQTDFENCKATTNPPAQGPVPQEKLDKIIYWDTIINNALELGNPPDHWNKMVQNISHGTYTATTRTAQVAQGVGSDGIYWCTNSVIDSYNLSEISGLGPQHQAVRNMLDFWKITSGYIFIPFSGVDSLRQAKPGYALFRLYPSSYTLDHVSIIKSISIDRRGNGSISTLDSNSLHSWTSTIENGKILDTFFLADIVGFGGIQ